MQPQRFILPNDPIHTGFLLVDASNMDDETFAKPLPMFSCTPAVLSQSEHLMPRLIDVAALSRAQQEGLNEVLKRELNGQRPPVVCAWIECALDIKALARHITRYLVGPGAEETPVYWRYFDPRVFSLALHMCSEEQVMALLGPIVEWRFPWCQRWWSVSGTGQDADPVLGITPAWPSEQQWQTLDDSDSITHVLHRLQDAQANGNLLADADCLRMQRDVVRWMLDAKGRWRLSDKDDYQEYALKCVRYGEEFRHHPKLADAWLELKEGRISWTELIGRLDEHDVRLLDKYCEPEPISRGHA